MVAAPTVRTGCTEALEWVVVQRVVVQLVAQAVETAGGGMVTAANNGNGW